MSKDYDLSPPVLETIDQVKEAVQKACPNPEQLESLVKMLIPFPALRADTERFLARCQECMHRGRFLASERGRTGLLPANSMAGDIVVVIFGCHVPLALRPLEAGGYTLLGECYLEGIMDGEMIQRLQDADRLEAETQEFRLV